MRSPTSRPGVFVPSSAAYHSEAALSFGSRTNFPITFPMTRDSSEFQAENRNVSRHSIIRSPIIGHPRQVCYLRHLGTRFPLYPILRSSTLCFPRLPSLQPDDDLMTSTLLSRAMWSLKNHRPSRSNSFILSQVLHPANTDGISSSYASNASIARVSGSSSGELPLASPSDPILNTPLLSS